MGVEWDVEGIVVVQLFVRQNTATEVLGILHTDMSSPASKDTHTHSQVLPKHTCTQTHKHRQSKHKHTHTHTQHITHRAQHKHGQSTHRDTHTHTCAHTHTHICVHMHAHMHARAHTHTCAHTRTNIHKHIQILQHSTHTHLSHVCNCWVTKSQIITTKDEEGTALTEKALTGPHFCRPP